MDGTEDRDEPNDHDAPRRGDIGRLEVVGAISAFVALAVAQPLFDLLSRNAEFFVARRAPVLDIVLFALSVALALPFLLAVMVMVCGRIHRRAGQVAFLVVLSTLGALLALRIFRQTFATLSNGTLVLVAAVAIGAALAWAVWSSGSFRSVLRWGPALAVAVIVWFLMMTPLSQLVFPREVALAEAGAVDRPADIVMLVMDELPLATLLDREHRIDERLFPNFARMAASSNWYRNATTVSHATSRAVPAIFDGQYPREGALPTAVDHPHNIFTLLGADYQVEAEELVTRLCPSQVCDPPLPSFEGRMGSLASDVGLITAHMLLPEDLTEDLPPVDEDWGDFATPDTPPDVAGVPGLRAVVGKGDPPSEIRAFIDTIRPRPGPQLYLKHTLLPHSPWRYLPEGYQYPESLPVPGTIPIPNREGTRWGEDRWLIAQAYQRHILQTMVADRVLGALLDRLEQTGMYKRSIVVVASDHGTAFIPGAPRRSRATETIGSIAPVPLFIKEPKQSRGRIIDAPVQTIDILPTIASLVGIEDAWDDLDGKVLSPDMRGTTDRNMGSGKETTYYSDDGSELAVVVRRKYEIFEGRRLDPYRLAPDGTRYLIGRAVPDGALRGPAAASIAGAPASDYRDIDLDGPVLPALLRGRLDLDGNSDPGAPIVAIALNETIVAVTRAREATEEGEFAFQALMPPRAFRNGTNELDFFLVDARPDGPLLSSVRQE